MKLYSRCFVLLALLMTLPGVGFGEIPDQLFSCAVFLRQETIKTTQFEGPAYEIWLSRPGVDPSGKSVVSLRPFPEVVTGSGVLVYTEGATQHVYIVTAAHVAKSMKPTGLAVIRGREDMVLPHQLSEFVGNATNLPWVMHDTADVAALLLNPDIEATQQIRTNYAIPLSSFFPEESAPDRESVLTTVGFPLALGVAGKFSPITKDSQPASGLITLARFDIGTPSTFFILQDPSVGGFSGAPIYETPGLKIRGGMQHFMTGFRCRGIIHGTLPDKTGGKFAAVTPSSAVVEVVTKAEKHFTK